MDAAAILTLAADVLDTSPIAATHQTFGHNSVTFDVTLPARHVIVRTNADARVFAATQRNLAVLDGLGLPVPHVLACDLTQTHFPFAYMILNKIPGRDLRYELADMRREQMTRLAERIVGFQQRVMTLPLGTGYGYVGIGEKGPCASWWELIQPEAANANMPAPDSPLKPILDRVLRQAQRWEPCLRQVEPVCFLDDITVKNVIVQEGELQGLVDFDCVCYGDPMYWLALTAVGVVSDVGMRELFYVEELKRLWLLTTAQKALLALYSAWIGADFMRRFAEQETAEWNARMLEAIGNWLHDVEYAKL